MNIAQHQLNLALIVDVAVFIHIVMVTRQFIMRLAGRIKESQDALSVMKNSLHLCRLKPVEQILEADGRFIHLHL